MNYRTFGHTDLLISEMGFGAWAIGGQAKVGSTPIGWGTTDDELSRKAIRAALDAGINFFDTADFYGLGHSEELLGEELSRQREVVIATKVGQRRAGETIILDYSRKYIIEACEASLKRLKREVIDYYQLHAARMHHLEQGECTEAMESLKRQGKIRYWGLSLNTFHPAPEAEFLLQHRLGDGFQLVLNLINQRALNVVRKAGAAGYGLIARMPLQFGLLTGKFSLSTRFGQDDHRSFRLTPEILEKSLKVLEEKVWPIADKENMGRTELALSFILNFSEISTVIAGMRAPEQAIENAGSRKRLSEPQIHYLQSLAKQDWVPVMELMEKQG